MPRTRNSVQIARRTQARSVGRSLALARKRAGLSQARAARALRLPQSAIGRLELGQRQLGYLEGLRLRSSTVPTPLASTLLTTTTRTDQPPSRLGPRTMACGRQAISTHATGSHRQGDRAMPAKGHKRADAVIAEAHHEMESLLEARDQLGPSHVEYIETHLSEHVDSTNPRLSDSDCFEALAVLAATLGGLSHDLKSGGQNGESVRERSRAFARLAVALWAHPEFRGERREFLVNLASQAEVLATPRPSAGAGRD
jgi:Helix-turn-helix